MWDSRVAVSWREVVFCVVSSLTGGGAEVLMSKEGRGQLVLGIRVNLATTVFIMTLIAPVQLSSHPLDISDSVT
jgi:hypothetical protein